MIQSTHFYQIIGYPEKFYVAYVCTPQKALMTFNLNVSQRENILIHPANDANHELKGCIAPVTIIIGVGKGIGCLGALMLVDILG